MLIRNLLAFSAMRGEAARASPPAFSAKSIMVKSEKSLYNL
jgi:hypothetical protein